MILTPLMLYFGPLKESGHFLFYDTGARVYSFERAKLGCPWTDMELDGRLQPGAPEPPDRLQRPTRRMREGEAVVHHKAGWTALSIWDFAVDTRPGCSSTYLAAGTFSFDEMVKLAQSRFAERWSKMRVPVMDVTE